MELPRQVRDAEKRSNDAIDALRIQQSGVQPEEGTQVDSPNPGPTEQPPPAEPPKDTGREDWKTKYHVLQGKYNAELPRALADLKAANARNEEHAIEIGRLKAEIERLKVPAQPAAPAEAPKVDIPQEVMDVLGEDAVAAIRRVVATEIDTALAPVKKQAEVAAATAEQVNAERAVTARDRFYSELSSAVPDFQAIDAREDWKQWLAQADPMSRRQRQQLLNEAAQAMDAQAVAAFFTAFKQVAGVASEPTKAKVPERLETLPQAGKPAAPSNEKRMWTRAQMAQVYKDLAIGRKYTHDEAAKLQAELVAAAREGRVKD